MHTRGYARRAFCIFAIAVAHRIGVGVFDDSNRMSAIRTVSCVDVGHGCFCMQRFDANVKEKVDVESG